MSIDISNIYGDKDSVSRLVVKELFNTNSLTHRLLNYSGSNDLFTIRDYIDEEYVFKLFNWFIKDASDVRNVDQNTIYNGIGRLNIFLITLTFMSKFLNHSFDKNKCLFFYKRQFKLDHITFDVKQNPFGARLNLIANGYHPQDNYIEFYIKGSDVFSEKFSSENCEDADVLFTRIYGLCIIMESFIQDSTVGLIAESKLYDLNKLKKDFEYICG